jgi:hypothetical protein
MRRLRIVVCLVLGGCTSAATLTQRATTYDTITNQAAAVGDYEIAGNAAGRARELWITGNARSNDEARRAYIEEGRGAPPRM